MKVNRSQLTSATRKIECVNVKYSAKRRAELLIVESQL